MLYAYTRNSAEALDQLSEIGSLKPGKRARPNSDRSYWSVFPIVDAGFPGMAGTTACPSLDEFIAHFEAVV
jgi:hypothetical protein